MTEMPEPSDTPPLKRAEHSDRADVDFGEPHKKSRRTRWGVAPADSFEAPPTAPPALSTTVTAAGLLPTFDVNAAAAAAKLALDKARRFREFQMQMKAQLAHIAQPVNIGGRLMMASVPRTVKFDHLGRQLDDTGKTIAVKPLVHSTLKINKALEREQRLKETYDTARVDRNLTDPSKNKWFDASLTAAPKTKKKGLRFVEPGRFQQKSEELRKRFLQRQQQMGTGTANGIIGAAADTAAGMQDDTSLLPNAVNSSTGKIPRSQRHLCNFTGIESWAKQQQSNKDDDDADSAGVDTTGTTGTDMVDDKKESSTSAVQRVGSAEASPASSSSSAAAHGGDLDVDVDGTAAGQPIGEPTTTTTTRMRPLPKSRAAIPDMEWWDVPLLIQLKDSKDTSEEFPYTIRKTRVTHLVEHPVPLEPPIMTAVSTSLCLTPKERAKLRRRKKMENEREKQDKIRMGLMAPPPPKTKLGNLMRVLGDQAVAQPSEMEAKVRKDMAQRLAGHQQRNKDRKLKPEDKSKRNAAKWQTLPVAIPLQAALFAVRSMSNRKFLFKVDRNAQQLHLSGAVVVCPGLPAVIIVEGIPRAVGKFRRLMTHRIKWYRDYETDGREEYEDDEDDDADDDGDAGTSSGKSPEVLNLKYCQTIWQGSILEKSFKTWRVYTAKVETEARKLFSDKHVVQYWEMGTNVDFTRLPAVAAV